MTTEAHRDDWSAVTSAAATAPTSTVEAEGKRARAILVARYSLVEERDSRLQQPRIMMRAKSETALARSVGRTTASRAQSCQKSQRGVCEMQCKGQQGKDYGSRIQRERTERERLGEPVRKKRKLTPDNPLGSTLSSAIQRTPRPKPLQRAPLVGPLIPQQSSSDRKESRTLRQGAKRRVAACLFPRCTLRVHVRTILGVSMKRSHPQRTARRSRRNGDKAQRE